MGNCGCSTSLSCCTPKKAVQDKICIDWAIDHTTGTDSTQIIYVNNVGTPVASGYFKLNSAATPATDTVTLTFYNGGIAGAVVQVITDIAVGEVKSFTVQNFDTIEITVPDATATGILLGELCLTPRYKI